MEYNINRELLCKKLRAIREGTSEFRKGKSLSCEKLANKIYELMQDNNYYHDRSYYRDLEANKKNEEILKKYAKLYFKVFKLSDEVQEKIWNSSKIVILDVTALMNRPHIIKDLQNEFYKIIIPTFVIDELKKIEKSNDFQKSKKARKTINELHDCDNTIKTINYTGSESDKIVTKIIAITKEASEMFISDAVIITADKGIKLSLSSDETPYKVMLLKEYVAIQQHITPENIDALEIIRNQKEVKDDEIINISKSDINSFFIDGRTLLTSCVADKKLDFELKKKKIKWLIKNGADVNKNDCASDFFPPLTLAVQMNDYNMVCFLLDECNADPNIASRYPYNYSTIGIQNEGNTALMVAAWQGLTNIVEKLCNHPDISINQQDRNGYTALIKACIIDSKRNNYQAKIECKKILEEHGADERIRDMNGQTAKQHFDQFASTSNYNSNAAYEEELKQLKKKYGII